MIEEIISKYYTPGRLRHLLEVHSRLVADLALECAKRSGLEMDLEFVEQAALLHDIGIVRCNALSIYCEGTMPYICHGVEGRKILEAEGLPRHALVCERHTGAGLTIEDIREQHLPLPLRDMTPHTLEEKAICYADKFYSKSGDYTQRHSLEKVMASMAKHGAGTLERFMALHKIFG